MEFPDEFIKIDTTQIAEGILAMINTEVYENALAFGMLPAPLMAKVKRSLETRYAEIIKDRFEMIYGEAPQGPVHDTDRQQRFVSQAMKEITLEALRLATNEGRVIV